MTVRMMWLGLGLLLVPMAFAQDDGMQTELERLSGLSLDELIPYAEAANLEIADAVREVERMQDIAERESAGEVTACVTSRLTTVRALQQVALGATAEMADHIESQDPDGPTMAKHAASRIAVAVSRSRQAVVQSQRCSAEGDGGDDTVVDVDGGADDTIDEAPEDPEPPTGPPPVSPFL